MAPTRFFHQIDGNVHELPDRGPSVTNASCDDHGRAVYSKILTLADFEDMSLKWDTTSFKIVVDVDGSQVPVCTAGLPGSKFGQAVWTTRGSDKAGTPADVFEQLRREAQQTGLFVPAGKESRSVRPGQFSPRFRQVVGPQSKLAIDCWSVTSCVDGSVSTTSVSNSFVDATSFALMRSY